MLSPLTASHAPISRSRRTEEAGIEPSAGIGDQTFQQEIRGFPAIIKAVISPGFIEGAAGLPWARDGLVRKLVVAHRQIIDSGGVPSGMIPGDADAAVDDAAARMHQIDQLLQPRLGEQRAFAPVVEPEEPDSVPVEQFGDLRQAFRGKVVFKFRIGGLLSQCE